MKGCAKYIIILAIGVLIGFLGLGHHFACGADDWKSPTSYTDPSSAWTDETKTYDANTATYGYTATELAYIELSIAPTDCDKVRIWAVLDSFGLFNPYVYVDVYYGSAWHNIQTGLITKGVWVELAIGSVQSVSKARIAANLGYLENLRLYEFQFNHYVPPPSVPTTLILLPASDSDYVNDYHSLNATVYDQYSELMEGIEVIWAIESGPGWFDSYDEQTDEDGLAYAVISSDEEGETSIKCSVDGYPAIYDTAIKSWQNVPVYTLVLDPGNVTNYIAANHTISACFYVDGEIEGGTDITWQINDVGWFRSYDEQTSVDESGLGYAVISSNVCGVTTIYCEAPGYEGASDSAIAYWAFPGSGNLTLEELESYIAGLNYTDLDAVQTWLLAQNYSTAQSFIEWLSVNNYTTAGYIDDWADTNNVVMGGVGMPLWFLLGLIALAAGAWWARSMIVNIMLMAMAGAGFPLAESTLPAGGALYYGVVLVLILCVVYALVQIFTRVEHF